MIPQAPVPPPPSEVPGAIPRSAIRWLMRGLALVALAISLYLLSVSLQGGSVAGCGVGEVIDCQGVLTSRWSRWLGVPVSAPAAGVYLAVLIGLGLIGPGRSLRTRTAAWAALLPLAVIILGAAVWFSLLQRFDLDRICTWCMAAHLCGAVLAGLLLVSGPLGRGSPGIALRRGSALGLAVLGLLPLAGLIVPQILITPEWGHIQPTGSTAGANGAPVGPAEGGGPVNLDTGPGPDRRISILAGLPGLTGPLPALRPHQFPVMGSPDAPDLLVCLFDYTCPHCRVLHHQLEQAVSHFQGRLGVVMVAVPLDARCNPEVTSTHPLHVNACELATLAYAVFRHAPEKFAAMDAFLFGGVAPPSPRAARAKAAELLGPDLEAALADPWPREQIARNMVLYKIIYDATDDGVLPRLIHRSATVSGQPPSAEELIRFLKDGLGIQPLTSAGA